MKKPTKIKQNLIKFFLCNLGHILCGIFVQNVQNSINLNYYQIRILYIHFKTGGYAKRFFLFKMFFFSFIRHATPSSKLAHK